MCHVFGEKYRNGIISLEINAKVAIGLISLQEVFAKNADHQNLSDLI
jgi:hypothetical protein